METIKVNMTPCEDIKTIHASQNDNEAREWGFELHNNGEKIDSSSISDQLVFKAYKGGTEQILPENGSTPTTSPFLGDIRYPQGLLSDQEFLYRESPTEEDGLAKITDIKGNTLVWNQLVQNGNFESTSNFLVIGATDFTVSGNVASFSVLTNDDRLQQNMPLTKGHKYLICMDVLNSSPNTMRIFWGQQISVIQSSSSWQRVKAITDTSSLATSGSYALGLRLMGTIASGTRATIQTKNWNCFDLTQMGIDVTDPSEFTSLFPLPFYDFNQGTLLSFNGTGIKTVSKNQFNVDDANADAYVTLEKGEGSIHITYDGTNAQRYRGFYMYRAEPYVNGHFLPTQYTVSFDVVGVDTAWVFGIRSVSTNSFHSTMRATINSDGHYSFTFNPSQLTEDYYLSASRTGNKTTAFDITFSNIQMEFETETEFEPYTSSLTELPISQYFSNGMKSAGNVYDELTESKAITRIGSVDLGSLTWTKTQGSTASNTRFYTNAIQNVIKRVTSNNSKANILTNRYMTIAENIGYLDQADGVSSDANGTLSVYDSTYSTVEDFKQAMQGVYLYYELKASTETSFTTASLVTENAEIPLSNNDGTLIGKCTEQLSENPGFFDAKIKLADSDGECYSNKIQLHVERSPQ